MESHRDPGGDPDREARGHRRGDHDLSTAVGALRRRGRAARDGCSLDRRPARSDRREPAPARRHRCGSGAPGGERAGREARRPASGRGHVRVGGDRGRGTRARRAGRRARDRERLRLRRLRRARVLARAERFRITHAGSFFGKRDPRPFLQAFRDADLDAVARFVGDFRASDREWAEALGLGDRLELVDYLPRRRVAALPARLRGAPPARAGRRRPRQGRALGEGVRVHRGRSPDPGGGPAGRRGGPADPRDRRRRRASRPTTSTRSKPRSSSCTRGSPTAACRRSSSRRRDEDRLSRRARVEEMASLLRSVV